MTTCAVGFTHGEQSCRACFKSSHHIDWHEKSMLVFDEDDVRWGLRPNPGYWGDADPKILVLGFSKGPDQQEMIDLYKRGYKHFEDIPFNSKSKQTRKALAEMLWALGVVPKGHGIANLFSEASHGFGFASIIRCSVEMTTLSTGRAASGSDLFVKTMKSSAPFVSECLQNYLVKVLKSVKLVILMGAEKDYVKACRERLSGIAIKSHAETAYAYKASGVTIVHVPHASGLASGYRKVFIGEKPPARGEINMLACRDQVIPAVRAALALV